jgi:hypothetical protein
MDVRTLSIAVALTLIPLPALAFNEHEFCATITDIAVRLNVRADRWVDPRTRYDGLEVDCEAKTLKAKRFLNAGPADMREGWETRNERAWNAAYCNNEAWREAIDNGWSIISSLTFRTGESLSFVAEC